jgi:hypothetical protein
MDAEQPSFHEQDPAEFGHIVGASFARFARPAASSSWPAASGGVVPVCRYPKALQAQRAQVSAGCVQFGARYLRWRTVLSLCPAAMTAKLTAVPILSDAQDLVLLLSQIDRLNLIEI